MSAQSVVHAPRPPLGDDIGEEGKGGHGPKHGRASTDRRRRAAAGTDDRHGRWCRQTKKNAGTEPPSRGRRPNARDNGGPRRHAARAARGSARPRAGSVPAGSALLMVEKHSAAAAALTAAPQGTRPPSGGRRADAHGDATAGSRCRRAASRGDARWAKREGGSIHQISATWDRGGGGGGDSGSAGRSATGRVHGRPAWDAPHRGARRFRAADPTAPRVVRGPVRTTRGSTLDAHRPSPGLQAYCS